MIFSTQNSSGVIVRSANHAGRENPFYQKLSEIINPENPENMAANNIYQLFKVGRSIAGDDGKYLGTRKDDNSPFEWISYGEFDEMITSCVTGLTALGIEMGVDVKIAAYCRMNPQIYCLIMAAAIRQNVIVPLYDTLGKPSIDYIVDQTEPKVFFCDRQKYLDIIMSLPKIKGTHIFVNFLITHELQQKVDQKGIMLTSFDNLLKLGLTNKKDLNFNKNSLDSLFYVMYTSGSTGVPKGVELTQRNFIFNVIGFAHHVLCETETLDLFDLSYFSYLPFQHSLESIFLLMVTMCGGKIGISLGNIKMIMSDVKEVKPTLFVAVPRVLDRFRERILKNVADSVFPRRFLFNWNFRRRENLLKSGKTYKESFIDKIIFSEIHAGFGSHLKVIIVGGAPLAKDLEIFTRVVFGAKLMQGYGLTETTAATMVQSVTHCGLNNCGIPLPGVEIKLEDVPELEYFAANGFGEVCIRGGNVTRGYYKRPDLVEESFSDDGFFRSGDIGRLNPNGTISIIDRCKNIFKLAQGEYIAPEKIENIYEKHHLVKQIMIDGDSTKAYILAVVVVDKKEFEVFARNICVNGHSSEEFLVNPAVVDRLLAELTKLATRENLHGFEQVKGIVLTYGEFTTENELLTPTMKMRRKQIKNLFCDQFQSLYAKGLS